MTRIPLRPDKAGEDLATLEAPPDWTQRFGRAGPLELEIGCGAGGFALEHCRRNPHVNSVAFEWRKKYAREVAHRAEKHGLTNLVVVEADARLAVPRLFADGTLDVIHLQFPDPWWKRAHFKRAILLPDFTALLLRKLKPGGRFDFRTDVEERARQGLAVLEQAGFVNPLGAGAFHPYDPAEAPSTRERRYLVSGQPVYRARLVKPG
ncbi:MAG: methyltransferase domain-containing protein [Myxococcaceae bacterium]|nr:methyltransferase domain-containing protein [Myxococcaceae bacterium]MCA3015518.1 methyltransferase domain-containing protein [Myxococcaceae bacterium]